MQRIRIGLTGLAFVFLFVMLFAAISRNGDPAPSNTAVNTAEPNEPLAELGVAPGQTEGDNQSGAADKSAP